MSGVERTQAVTYSGDACKEQYYDVLIRFKIEEHRGVYQWKEFDSGSVTIAQLKTAVQTMIDDLKTAVEATSNISLT